MHTRRKWWRCTAPWSGTSFLLQNSVKPGTPCLVKLARATYIRAKLGPGTMHAEMRNGKYHFPCREDGASAYVRVVAAIVQGGGVLDGEAPLQLWPLLKRETSCCVSRHARTASASLARGRRKAGPQLGKFSHTTSCALRACLP